jgi:hypothetical protein
MPAKVLQTLLAPDAEEYMSLEPIVDIEARLFDAPNGCDKCERCNAMINFTYLKEQYSLANIYVHCLVCRHAQYAVDHHLIIAENRYGYPSEQGETPEWFVFIYNHKNPLSAKTLEGCLNVATSGPSTQAVSARLSLKALHQLLEYDANPTRLKLETQPLLLHEPSCGWRLVD